VFEVAYIRKYSPRTPLGPLCSLQFMYQDVVEYRPRSRLPVCIHCLRKTIEKEMSATLNVLLPLRMSEVCLCAFTKAKRLDRIARIIYSRQHQFVLVIPYVVRSSIGYHSNS